MVWGQEKVCTLVDIPTDPGGAWGRMRADGEEGLQRRKVFGKFRKWGELGVAFSGAAQVEVPQVLLVTAFVAESNEEISSNGMSLGDQTQASGGVPGRLSYLASSASVIFKNPPEFVRACPLCG